MTMTMGTPDTESHFENWYEGWVEHLYDGSKMAEARVDEYLEMLDGDALKEIYLNDEIEHESGCPCRDSNYTPEPTGV